MNTKQPITVLKTIKYILIKFADEILMFRYASSHSSFGLFFIISLFLIRIIDAIINGKRTINDRNK